MLGYDLAPIDWFADGGRRAEGRRVDARRALHRRGRRAVRADRHRARDPPGAVDLAADQAARVEGRPDRARRSRRARRDHVDRRDRPARRELQLHGRPDRDPARADRREGADRAGARGRQGDPGDAGADRAIRSTAARCKFAGLLPAGGADRRRLVDVARAGRRQGAARDRRRHRPRRAVGDDHRGREGGVRRRALRPRRRRHGDAAARDHEPRDLRERAAPVRDDVLRVDRRHQARARSRTRTPATTSRTCSAPARARASSAR